MIYKNIVPYYTKYAKFKFTNLKKKSNLICNSLKFKSMTQDENEYAK